MQMVSIHHEAIHIAAGDVEPSKVIFEKPLNFFKKVYPIAPHHIVEVLRIGEIINLFVLAYALADVAQGVLPKYYIV